MTKSTGFIPVESTYSEDDYSRISIDEIVFCHGIPLSIILDRAPQFTSRFYRLFKKGLGITVKLSTIFHPHIDGQVESTIQTLEDMLRTCIIDFKGNWHKYFPLVQFAYNSSFHSSISMALYEALYGKGCRYLIVWLEVCEPSLLGPLDKVHITGICFNLPIVGKTFMPIIGEGI